MKIAVVAYGSGSSEFAGPGSPVPELAAALADSGHEVVLVMRREATRVPTWLAGSPFRTRLLAAGPSVKLDDSAALEHVGTFVRNLSREIRLGGYDVLHSHGWVAGLATQLAARSGPVPVAHTFHRLLHSDEPSGQGPDLPSRVRVERACASHADHLIAASTAEQQTLIKMGVLRSRITVVPPGVVSAESAGPITATDHARMVMFGPPERAAGVMRALRQLPDVDLVLCGTPEQPNGDTDEQTRLVAELGLQGRVSWQQANTPARRAAVLRGAQLAVCMTPPSRAGTEHLEAMALGVPVVAGDAPATEAVVDGVTGQHAPDLRPRALTGLLGELLASRATRQQMSISGRDRASMRYNWSRIAEETARIYTRMTTPVSPPEPRRPTRPNPGSPSRVPVNPTAVTAR